ncbi:DUF3168 domain-containing protein [Rhizobium sp. Root1220]|uniref:DUF3168 domain-containing protein n=1 Tax=Rhizobium sp. Root1220 TaxID=1736432 RepID=UPI0006FEF923|nr:DUF3168 domain-containing protein [Rhizobium sp. Root1220]KQV63830.1 hypothetical protein ASC90_17830 [Rhizobium sp. Root1220]
MSAANELLAAVHARLTGDAQLTALVGADAIRDRLVSGRKLPSIVIGDLVSNDYSTSTEAGEEHLLTLEIWSDANGRMRTQDIAACVFALLHDAPLDLASAHLVALRHRLTRTRREPKAKLHVAEMRFRAVTEQAPRPPAP